MATNPYFESLYSARTQDQSLYHDLIIESIQIKGRDMFYLPRTLTNFDKFFGEDSTSAFNDAITLEFYLENVQAWEGDNKFLSKFGLEIHDEATLVVSRKRFAEEVTSIHTDIKVPREGDVIVLPDTLDRRTRAFEISYVDGESVFYQLGELYVWKLKIRNFEYNGETFNTGIDELDDYESENSVATIIDLLSGTGSYLPGEIVEQVSGWSATVVAFLDDKLTVIQTNGQFVATDDIVGQDSGATWVSEKVISETAQDSGNPDNDYIQRKESDIVNFSEADPFSGM